MSAERQARRRLHPKFVALVDKHGLGKLVACVGAPNARMRVK